jgi:hypothetical protein
MKKCFEQCKSLDQQIKELGETEKDLESNHRLIFESERANRILRECSDQKMSCIVVKNAKFEKF